MVHLQIASSQVFLWENYKVPLLLNHKIIKIFAPGFWIFRRSLYMSFQPILFPNAKVNLQQPISKVTVWPMMTTSHSSFSIGYGIVTTTYFLLPSTIRLKQSRAEKGNQPNLLWVASKVRTDTAMSITSTGSSCNYNMAPFVTSSKLRKEERKKEMILAHDHRKLEIHYAQGREGSSAGLECGTPWTHRVLLWVISSIENSKTITRSSYAFWTIVATE